jgi:hypothetical protein
MMAEGILGGDELPTTQGLRRGQAQSVAQPIGEGAPKRSDGGPLIRVCLPGAILGLDRPSDCLTNRQPRVSRSSSLPLHD